MFAFHLTHVAHLRSCKEKIQFDFCDFSGETPDARVRWLRHKCWSYQMSIITEAIKVEFNTCVKIQEHPDMLSCPKFIPIFTIVPMFSRPKVRLCPHALLAYLKILNAIENVNRLFSHPSCYQLCRGDVEGGVPNLGKQNLGNRIWKTESRKKSGKQNLGDGGKAVALLTAMLF